MNTETIIFESVARRLEAGTYLPRTIEVPAVDGQPMRHYVAEIIGSALLGAFIALAFMV